MPDPSGAPGCRPYSMMNQSAAGGMGVAPGHSLPVALYLERGELVGPFDPPVPAPARYYLVVAPEAAEKPEAPAFVERLRVEAGKGGSAC